MSDPAVQFVPGQAALSLGAFDIADLGYEASEYFVTGEAISHAPAGDLESDGMWAVEPGGKAGYVTRIVVLRPTDPARFSGSVLMEWLNVTAGVDAPVDWCMAHREIARAGHAYVAVSAQSVGIEGGLSRGMDRSLKTLSPDRYASLHHPGDAFSYDIFSQIGRLVRKSPEILFGPLAPRHVIAIGESQSAWYLITYVNAIDPLAKAYDGFLLHSRFAPAAPLDGVSIFADATETMPAAPRIRADMRVPVMTVITETDLIGGLRPGFHPARQPDDGRVRLWEIPGAAHADNYAIQVGAIDNGLVPVSRLAAAYAPTSTVLGMDIGQFVNFAPQHHYVLQAALAGLDRWVRTGVAPAEAPRIMLNDADTPTILLDANGIATGGIRTPWVDVPVARTSGLGNPASAASLFGSGEPFDGMMLERLYPNGRPEYLARFEAALDDAIGRGFLLAADREEILELAGALCPAW